ncbi:unnamed protein product [Caretta caretta]
MCFCYRGEEPTTYFSIFKFKLAYKQKSQWALVYKGLYSASKNAVKYTYGCNNLLNCKDGFGATNQGHMTSRHKTEELNRHIKQLDNITASRKHHS